MSGRSCSPACPSSSGMGYSTPPYQTPGLTLEILGTHPLAFLQVSMRPDWLNTWAILTSGTRLRAEARRCHPVHDHVLAPFITITCAEQCQGHQVLMVTSSPSALIIWPAPRNSPQAGPGAIHLTLHGHLVRRVGTDSTYRCSHGQQTLTELQRTTHRTLHRGWEQSWPQRGTTCILLATNRRIAKTLRGVPGVQARHRQTDP